MQSTLVIWFDWTLVVEIISSARADFELTMFIK